MTLQVFSHLQALFGDNSLYELENDKDLKLNVKQLQFTALAFHLVLHSLSHDIFQQLHSETLVVKRLKVIYLNDRWKVVQSPLTSAETALFL